MKGEPAEKKERFDARGELRVSHTVQLWIFRVGSHPYSTVSARDNNPIHRRKARGSVHGPVIPQDITGTPIIIRQKGGERLPGSRKGIVPTVITGKKTLWMVGSHHGLHDRMNGTSEIHIIFLMIYN
jgi:hypothetical protein